MLLFYGQAAVSANLVSPILIIIVSITAICSFTIPDFSLGFSLRILRFLYIALGYLAGLLGIAITLFSQFVILVSTKSFGISYFAPYLPITNLETNSSYFVSPIWKKEKRAESLNAKNPFFQDKISMKWKFWKGK